MKKVIICMLILCTTLCVTGCDLFNRLGKDRTKLGGWNIDTSATMLNIPNDALVAYNKAIQDYTSMKVEPIAYLGSQVVSGTNYMYLCKATTLGPDSYTNYRVMVVYNNLQGKASVKSIKNFDIVSYADKDIPVNNEQLSGGWTVNTNMSGANLDNPVQYAFKDATSKISGTTYQPIALLASKGNGGNDFVVLALAKRGSTYSINVLTIYEQLDGTSEVSSTAYVDLGDFN